MNLLTVKDEDLRVVGARLRALQATIAPDELRAAVLAAEQEIPQGLPPDPGLVGLREACEALAGPDGQQRHGLLAAKAREIVRWRRARAWRDEQLTRRDAAQNRRRAAAQLEHFVQSRLGSIASDFRAEVMRLGLDDHGAVVRSLDYFSDACTAVISETQGARKVADEAAARSEQPIPHWLADAPEEHAA